MPKGIYLLSPVLRHNFLSELQRLVQRKRYGDQAVGPVGRGRYFAGIIVCIVLLYFFNNLLSIYLLQGVSLEEFVSQ